MLVAVRVRALVLFCCVSLSYTPVPLFAFCLLPLNQEVTPQAGDAGVPTVFMIVLGWSRLDYSPPFFIFASHSV